MTIGLAIQRASNAKTLILLFQDYRSTFVHQHHAKNNSTKVTSHGRRGFHHHWQLYCLFNSRYRNTWRKSTWLRTTDPLRGHTTGDLWNVHYIHIVCSTPHNRKIKESIKIPLYWSLMGRQIWWPMESPHNVPAMRKALIMQSQDCRFSFFSSILWKLHWHKSVRLFDITFNSTVVSTARTGKRKRSALLIPCGENPSVTNGISTQRAGNAKAFITQFQQDYMSRLCHRRLRKDKLYKRGQHVSVLGFHLIGNYIDGLVVDCSNSIANALESLQSRTKPSLLFVNSAYRKN